MVAPLDRDLIAAIATAPGQGGIGIVRLSGPGADHVASQICTHVLQPRIAQFTRFVDNPSQVADSQQDLLDHPDLGSSDQRQNTVVHSGEELIDEGLALYFPAPRSFTGEDVVELHGHGGPIVMRRLLDAVCARGARLARPGEFSERAFHNGKLDLAQAEAVADLIASTSVAAARAAVNSLTGKFSDAINDLAKAIQDLRIVVEAAIDFPEEDVEILQEAQIGKRVASLRTDVAKVLATSRQGALLSEGITIALMGEPNVGKSSLLNALCGEEAAIVTDIPGTTRDLLKVDLVLDGLPVRLVDTAGLREAQDTVEAIGVKRAKAQAATADVVVHVVDATNPSPQEIIEALPVISGKRIVVINKIDLLDLEADQRSAITASSTIGPTHKPSADTQQDEIFRVSAKIGTGLGALREGLLRQAGFTPDQAPYTARARHVTALELAAAHLGEAARGLDVGDAVELVAEHLRQAHDQLGEIVGTISADDLLGKIFSEFCIGK